jgi:hypothetical protein
MKNLYTLPSAQVTTKYKCVARKIFICQTDPHQQQQTTGETKSINILRQINVRKRIEDLISRELT